MTKHNQKPQVNTRELVYDMLLHILKEEMPSHLVLSDTLDRYSWLDKQERAFMTRLMRGTLQNILYLDQVLLQCADIRTKKLKMPVRVIVRPADTEGIIQVPEVMKDGAASGKAPGKKTAL